MPLSLSKLRADLCVSASPRRRPISATPPLPAPRNPPHVRHHAVLNFR
jgi:hypothetical protein